MANTYGGKKKDWVKKVGKIESGKYIFDVHWVEHPELGTKEHKIVTKKVEK